MAGYTQAHRDSHRRQRVYRAWMWFDTAQQLIELRRQGVDADQAYINRAVDSVRHLLTR